MESLGTHKRVLSKPHVRKKTLTLPPEKVEEIVKNLVKESSYSIRMISGLNDIVIESIETDFWGEIPVCYVRGHIEAWIKTGFFSRQLGKKSFHATIKAKTGETLSISWEPGEIVSKTR